VKNIYLKILIKH